MYEVKLLYIHLGTFKDILIPETFARKKHIKTSYICLFIRVLITIFTL